MNNLTHAEAQYALAARANAQFITQADVKALLASVRGVAFANIAYVTKVGTAAAHKLVNIQKVTVANVQLFNNLNEFTHVYTNAVNRSAQITDFEASDNWFSHTETYSIVAHKKDADKVYLYAIYNNAQSVYFIDGVAAGKTEVSAYLTASAARLLLSEKDTVHNVTNDVTHNVHVRVVELCNIVSMKAQKQILAV